MHTTKTALIAAYRTPYDGQPGSARAINQYAQGRYAQYTQVVIGINGEWTGSDGSLLFSSCGRKLGYHANTADLLRGWLDAGIAIIDKRAELGFSSCGNCGGYANSTACIDGLCPQCGSPVLPNIEGGE